MAEEKDEVEKIREIKDIVFHNMHITEHEYAMSYQKHTSDPKFVEQLKML
jgi:hypothetical protein